MSAGLKWTAPSGSVKPVNSEVHNQTTQAKNRSQASKVVIIKSVLSSILVFAAV